MVENHIKQQDDAAGKTRKVKEWGGGGVGVGGVGGIGMLMSLSLSKGGSEDSDESSFLGQTLNKRTGEI